MYDKTEYEHENDVLINQIINELINSEINLIFRKCYSSKDKTSNIHMIIDTKPFTYSINVYLDKSMLISYGTTTIISEEIRHYNQVIALIEDKFFIPIQEISNGTFDYHEW